MKIVLVALYDIHSIGIRTINALLKSDEHDTTAVFFKNHYSNEESTDTELADLADAINSQYADVLGFAVRSPFLPVFKRLLPLIENNPFILVGRHHATICPEAFIGLADAICVGEGEESLLTLEPGKKGKKRKKGKSRELKINLKAYYRLCYQKSVVKTNPHHLAKWNEIKRYRSNSGIWDQIKDHLPDPYSPDSDVGDLDEDETKN